MGLRLGITIAGVVVGATLSTSASADGPMAVDWSRVLVEVDHFARHGAAEVAQGSSSSIVTSEHTSQPLEHNAGNAWFGVAPSVTLVARDWGEAYRLAGDRLSLPDEMRLSSSTRMIVSRARLSDSHISRITPFAQLGAGQWRTDTNIMPHLHRSTEIAAQVGGGFEMRVAHRWELAWETSATLLIREEREAESIPMTKLWSTMLASRVSF
jgi:hypothetical protein